MIATRLLENGTDLRYIQERLGHNGFDWILILHHKRLDFADIVDSIRFDKLPDQTTHRNPIEAITAKNILYPIPRVV